MAYNPTAFKNGGPPAISAEELNKFGQGIKEAHDQLERLSYDLYNLYQEQYYTGNSPTSPSFGAAKSLVFDTLSKEGTYNTADSTVLFNVDRIMANLQPEGYQYPVSAIDYPFNGYTKGTNGIEGVPSNLLADDSVFVGFEGSTTSMRQHYPIRLDMGSVKQIMGLEYQGVAYDSNLENMELFVQEPDGTYESLYYSYLPYNSPSQTIQAQFSASDILLAKARYFYLDISDGNQTADRAKLDYIKLLVANYVQSTYRSKPFMLDFVPQSATAYVSAIPLGDGAVTDSLEVKLKRQDGSLVSGVPGAVRFDPNFPGFLEIQFEFDLTGSVQPPNEVQMVLKPINGNTPTVKRYGVYFY